MQIGIVTRTYKVWIGEFINACKSLGINSTLIEIDKNDWIEQLKDINLILWRIHLGDLDGLNQARIKIPIMEKMGIFCFPSSLMSNIYDNKILQSYYFALYNIPTPKTFISYSKDDADQFCSSTQFPLIAKTNGGASSSGVFLLHKMAEAKKYNKLVFNNSIAGRIIKKLKRNSIVDNLLHFSYKDDKLKYVYFQEFIKAEGDFRVTTMGNNIVSVFKRYNRKNDFRASGSGLWEKVDITTLPIEACNIALDLSKKFHFTSMAYDFIKKNNQWLILEISYSFLLNDIYANTLFEKKGNTYIKISPIPIGLMHIKACLNEMMLDKVTGI